MKEHFNQAIINLKQMVAQIATDAENALADSIRAAGTHDVDLAKKIIDGDFRIDCAEIKIEEECLKILALYQPVASDLRTIITILKVNVEVERVADMACNISGRVIDMAKYDEEKVHRFDFSKMAVATREMLRQALDAMTYRDPEIAERVLKMDDAVDEMNRDNFRWARERISEDPKNGGYYLDCLSISKNLERVGDTATNICEDVIYLERGKIIRHGNT